MGIVVLLCTTAHIAFIPSHQKKASAIRKARELGIAEV